MQKAEVRQGEQQKRICKDHGRTHLRGAREKRHRRHALF